MGPQMLAVRLNFLRGQQTGQVGGDPGSSFWPRDYLSPLPSTTAWGHIYGQVCLTETLNQAGPPHYPPWDQPQIHGAQWKQGVQNRVWFVVCQADLFQHLFSRIYGFVSNKKNISSISSNMSSLTLLSLGFCAWWADGGHRAGQGERCLPCLRMASMLPKDSTVRTRSKEAAVRVNHQAWNPISHLWDLRLVFWGICFLIWKVGW